MALKQFLKNVVVVLICVGFVGVLKVLGFRVKGPGQADPVERLSEDWFPIVCVFKLCFSRQINALEQQKKADCTYPAQTIGKTAN